MNILKQIAQRVLPVAVLAFVITAAIAYQRGVYDFTFIERPQVSDTTEVLTDTEAPDTTEPVTTAPDTSVDTVPVETPPPEPQLSKIEEFLAPLYTTETLKNSGYTVTDTEWTYGYAFGRAELTAVTASAYSLRTRVAEVPERVPYGKYSGYVTQINKVTEDRPALEVYMDYIIADKGESVDLLRADGTLLAADFDIDTYRPAYTRDKQDRALFIAETPSRYNPRNTVTQYYYLDENGTPTVSDYNDKVDGRGLYINYPTYYGKTSDKNYTRYYDKTTGLYAFANINGYPRTEVKYLKVFNFSEDMAAVVNQEGFMSFVSKNFADRIVSGTMSYQSYKNTSDRRVYNQYLLPDTYGIESLGFFYFDHGLVRVRRQIIDAPHFEMHGWREIASDEDVLLRTDGTEFITPTDYTATAYSNGMILLEKDGYYGFMDYTGKWIIDPVYTSAEPFNEGLAVIGRDGKMGMIDTNGEFVIPMIFDYVGSVSGGIVTAWDESCGWIILNKVVWTGN
ncbi:MAG: WG repeat-containing protein [Clostridia bacterium]|nr:WG repeat-containing protein [Clostridia bacterium]